MATNDFVRFRSEYLPKHPDLQRKLDALTDARARANAMVSAGHEAGFSFSAAEAEAGLRTSEKRIGEADAELTDVQPRTATNVQFLALQEATQMESRKRTIEGGSSVAPHETQLQYSGRVTVDEDGNGVTAETFATTVGGDQVRYVLIVANEICPDRNSSPPPAAPCPPPVTSITITLNDDVVLQAQAEFERDRVEVALFPSGGNLNVIVITAKGQPGSVARVVVLAERPADVYFAGLSVLPWARVNDRVHTFLAVHNAGTAEIGVRLAFFEPDGSDAGRSGPRLVARHATLNLNLNEVATSLGLLWTKGAVHVEWVARGPSRVSTVASEERREPDLEESRHVITGRTLALDDYSPRPVTAAAAEEFLGGTRVPS